METLITGGTGLLGRHLVIALQERGDSVRALVLPAEDASWLQERGVAIYRGDIRQPETLTAAMRGVDVVFHLAAMQGQWRPIQDYRDTNVRGTENVCRAALATGARRIVHVSSWTIYGMALHQPVREDSPLAPWHDPYWITKAEGDELVRRMIAEEGLQAAIIRPGTLFGPGDRLNFGRIAERLAAGKGLIIGSGRNAVPLIYVTDVVQGLLLAADRERAVGQVYNITNDHFLTQGEFLSTIAQELGVAPPRIHVPYKALYAAAYVAERIAMLPGYGRAPIVTRHGVALFGADSRISIDKARAELGYVPQVSLREGIRLAAVWYRQQQGQAAVSVAAAVA